MTSTKCTSRCSQLIRSKRYVCFVLCNICPPLLQLLRFRVCVSVFVWFSTLDALSAQSLSCCRKSCVTQTVAVWEELYLSVGKTELFFIKCHQGVDKHPPKVIYRCPYAFLTAVRAIIGKWAWSYLGDFIRAQATINCSVFVLSYSRPRPRPVTVAVFAFLPLISSCVCVCVFVCVSSGCVCGSFDCVVVFDAAASPGP
jgi:hypothetical protein